MDSRTKSQKLDKVPIQIKPTIRLHTGGFESLALETLVSKQLKWYLNDWGRCIFHGHQAFLAHQYGGDCLILVTIEGEICAEVRRGRGRFELVDNLRSLNARRMAIIK